MIDFGNSITKRPFLHQTEGGWRKLGIYAEEINLLEHLGDKEISHFTKSLEPSLSCSFISMSGPFGPAVGDPVRVCLLNRCRPRRQEQVWQRAETFAQHHRDRRTTSPLGISEMLATRLQSKLPFGKDPAESSLETHTGASGVVMIWWSAPLSAKPAFIQRLDKLKFGSEGRRQSGCEERVQNTISLTKMQHLKTTQSLLWLQSVSSSVKFLKWVLQSHLQDPLSPPQTTYFTAGIYSNIVFGHLPP